METVQQAVQTASNAVWNGVDALRGNNQTEQRANQHGDEPMSGIQGKGTVTDPYDAGNRDEQIGAPINKDNTAVVTEPLSSTTTGTTGTFNDKYQNEYGQNQSDKANLVTSSLGPQNPRVDHPEPVQGKQHTSGPSGMSTLKDEPLSTHRSTLKDEPLSTHRSTLRDESITSSGPAPDKAETIATHKASAADAATAAARSTSTSASGSGTGAGAGSESKSASESNSGSAAPNNTGNIFSTTEPASEQREQPSTTQPENTQKDKGDDKEVPATNKANSETGGISSAEVAEKKGVSPEALRGPSVGAPRESYQRQVNSVGGKKPDDEPKTTKTEGKDNKEKDEHHHKSMKERLNKVLHHH